METDTLGGHVTYSVTDRAWRLLYTSLPTDSSLMLLMEDIKGFAGLLLFRQQFDQSLRISSIDF